MQQIRSVAGIVCVLMAIGVEAVEREIDYPYLGTFRLVSSRSEALGGASLALPDGIVSAIANPALLHAFSRTRPAAMPLGMAIGYGRDSLFNQHIVPVGLFVGHSDYGSIGGLYRMLLRDTAHVQYEAAIVYSNRFFEKNVNQGAVDFGLTVRYEHTTWTSPVFDTLKRYIQRYDTLGNPRGSVTTSISGLPRDKSIRQDRVVIDIGLYQKDFADHLDFGVTGRNLLGYFWDEWNPRKNIEQHQQKINDTIIDTVTSTYVNENYSQEYWIENRYRNLSVGVVWYDDWFDKKVHITVPADLDFLSLFERTQPLGIALRVGVEALFAESYYVRLGYSHAPVLVRRGDNFVCADRFGGGLGFTIGPVGLDIYVRLPYEWGLTFKAGM